MNRILFALVLAGVAAGLRADVVLSPLFSDHAVLQASTKTPVWGRADPGEAVRVTLGAANAPAVTSADGKWRVELDLREVGPGPFDLVVEGRNRLVSADVVVGEVWLCSGQSNMEWPLRGSGGAAAQIAKSENPRLRHFLVKKTASPEPAGDVEGRWEVATPETTPDFTAAGYYFGQSVQRALGVPVGLINASWGGTPVEAWTRTEAFDADEELKAGAEKARRVAAEHKAFLNQYREWMVRHERQDRAPAAPEAFDAFAAGAPGWNPVNLPGSLAAAGLPDSGAVWIAKKITLPAGAVGAGLQVWFGEVNDAVQIYWNGIRVGGGGVEAVSHRYSLHAKHVTSAEGVLTARIFSPAGGAGMKPGNARFRIDHRGGSIPLEGEWLAKAEYAFPPAPEGAAACPIRPGTPRSDPNIAGYLFDGMIRPLMPAAIAGVIWYQGEHNWDRGRQYRAAFQLMIADWRRQWGRGDFPFYFCQLPNYQQPPAKPGESNWAEVRESQAAALALPRTGMAVLIDVGEAGNIHPADKRSVGERLARLALAGTYGKTTVVASGPMFASFKIEGAAVRVAFTGTEGGLVAKPVTPASPRSAGAVQGFMICGQDRRWEWAEATIEGSTVVVRSPNVPLPVAVRYAWADNPVCNLYNGAGLPAAPFRTDDFPMISLKAHY